MSSSSRESMSTNTLPEARTMFWEDAANYENEKDESCDGVDGDGGVVGHVDGFVVGE
jgi:hypothetical protein